MRAVRNIFGFVLAVSGGLFLGDFLFQKYGADRLGDWLRFLFAIYMPLVPLLFQIIHKLSDLGELDGLDRRERENLRKLASGKTNRLWWLIALCVLSAFSGWASYLTAKDAQLGYFVVLLACTLGVSSIYWSMFIPSMFHEIVRFRSQIYERLEERRSKEDLLSEMRREAEEGFKSDARLDAYNEIVKPG